LHGLDKKENFLPFAETAALMRLPSCLLGFAVLLLGFPLASSATIYKWTDEHGTTVYSNRAPAAEAKVSNVQVALEDERPAAAAPSQPNPNELQNRVRALEQQVQSLQNQPAAAAPYPVQPPPVSYYPPPDYYPQQQPYYPQADYSSMYDSGYPYGYGYPYYPYYSTIVVTGRRFFRPVHVHPVHGFVGNRPIAVPRGTVAGAGARSMPVSGFAGGSGRR
jgi:hypothetical protein